MSNPKYTSNLFENICTSSAFRCFVVVVWFLPNRGLNGSYCLTFTSLQIGEGNASLLTSRCPARSYFIETKA